MDIIGRHPKAGKDGYTVRTDPSSLPSTPVCHQACPLGPHQANHPTFLGLSFLICVIATSSWNSIRENWKGVMLAEYPQKGDAPSEA